MMVIFRNCGTDLSLRVKYSSGVVEAARVTLITEGSPTLYCEDVPIFCKLSNTDGILKEWLGVVYGSLTNSPR